MNDSRNFNKIFRKDVNYNNIKMHKKQSFTLLLEDAFLESPQEGGRRQFKLVKPPKKEVYLVLQTGTR